MYTDYPPHHIPAKNVLVLEGTETDPEDVINEALCGGAYFDHPDSRVFYIVFLAAPQQVEVMTERVLRQTIVGKGAQPR